MSERIREAFTFLVDAHGYRLVADSGGGMGGCVTYRSEELWIAVPWDRGEPWLEFAPTRSAAARFDWELVEHVLRGAAAFEHADVPAREAPPQEAAAWLGAHLAEIEARFRPPARDSTLVALHELEAQRRLRQKEYWANRQPRGAT